MPFADHHDMVKAFPSHRSNHALCIGVLPGRAWRNDRLSFAKTSARGQVIDLSALIRTQSESMITLLLHLQTISMTMRYSHLAPDHLRAAVAVLDGVLFASQPTQTAAVSAQASTQEPAELVGVSQKSL